MFNLFTTFKNLNMVYSRLQITIVLINLPIPIYKYSKTYLIVLLAHVELKSFESLYEVKYILIPLFLNNKLCAIQKQKS